MSYDTFTKGDVVYFIHQEPDDTHVIANTVDLYGNAMVELEGMSGQFATVLFRKIGP